MLNLFAATGHIHYAKSGRLYLQQMLELSSKHPEIHEQFVSFGHHVIRRTDKYWSGIWSDLVIEQVLMRSIKSVGGLTRGRGFAQSTRDQWTLTAHHTGAIHEGMTQLTNVHNGNSDQHMELSEAKKKRDSEDGEKIYVWLKEHNPFTTIDSRLRSISTGITSQSELTCDKAEEIGEDIQLKLDNVAFAEAKIKRNDRVKGLDSKTNNVSINNKDVAVNPTLLFNRLSALAGREENVAVYFEHELTPYPMSLFKDGLMRKPDKSSLKPLILPKTCNIESPLSIVIDGGALLHKVLWPPSLTYRELLGHYVSSVRRRYGKCCVVFDGYGASSTKDHEHLRRSAKIKSPDIQFMHDMPVVCSFY